MWQWLAPLGGVPNEQLGLVSRDPQASDHLWLVTCISQIMLPAVFLRSSCGGSKAPDVGEEQLFLLWLFSWAICA